MKSGASHRRSTPRPGKRAKKTTHPARVRQGSGASTAFEVVPSASAPCDIVQPDSEAREPSAVGWAYAEPPRLSGGRSGTGATKYRVVIDCVLDLRKPGTSE